MRSESCKNVGNACARGSSWLPSVWLQAKSRGCERGSTHSQISKALSAASTRSMVDLPVPGGPVSTSRRGDGGSRNWRLTSAVCSHFETSATFCGCIARSSRVLGAYFSHQSSDGVAAVPVGAAGGGRVGRAVAPPPRGPLRRRDMLKSNRFAHRVGLTRLPDKPVDKRVVEFIEYNYIYVYNYTVYSVTYRCHLVGPTIRRNCAHKLPGAPLLGHILVACLVCRSIRYIPV